MKLFCAALTAAPVTGDNSIVPIAIIAMAVVVVIAAVLLAVVPSGKCNTSRENSTPKSKNSVQFGICNKIFLIFFFRLYHSS